MEGDQLFENIKNIPQAVDYFINKYLLPFNSNFHGLKFKNYFLYTKEVNFTIKIYEDDDNIIKKLYDGNI